MLGALRPEVGYDAQQVAHSAYNRDLRKSMFERHHRQFFLVFEILWARNKLRTGTKPEIRLIRYFFFAGVR